MLGFRNVYLFKKGGEAFPPNLSPFGFFLETRDN